MKGRHTTMSQPSKALGSRSDGDSEIQLVASAETLETFCDDVGLLWSPPVSSLPKLDPPSPLEFATSYVSRSRPCIIRNAILQNHSSPSDSCLEDATKPLHMTLDDIVHKSKTNNGVDTLITVDVTPDGHGDCIRSVDGFADDKTDRKDNKPGSRINRMFVKPLEKQMSLDEFRTKLRRKPPKGQKSKFDEQYTGQLDENSRQILSSTSSTEHNHDRHDQPPSDLPEDSVVYYSRQNDCLRTEFSYLQDCFPSSFAWAQDAFGTGPPDAINLWIGNERAVSSMHKDHYENLFYVLSGEKVFTLCPPADVAFLYEQEYDSGEFVVRRGDHGKGDDCDGRDGVHDNNYKWMVQPNEGDKVRWISPDVQGLLPSKKDAQKPNVSATGSEKSKSILLSMYPLLKYIHPIEVRVQAGEMLYLPSLWFHRVTQSCETVGINYWFDMHFDSPNWCYFHLLQEMRALSTTSISAQHEEP